MRLGLEINNYEFGVRKIVLLAMSYSIKTDNLGANSNNVSKRTLERERAEGRNESNGED